MTRAEAIADLQETFGRGNVVAQDIQTEPGMVIVIITTKQQVPNRDLASEVAFKLPEQINGRPQHFVETHLTLPNGGQPNNATNQEVNGRLWKTWSLNTPWDPARHTLSQLVHTVIAQWDR